MSDYVVGVDLGGTKIDIGLVDADNRIVARRRIPTQSEQGGAAVVERIADVLADFARETGTTAVALGICTPGPVDHVSGTLLTLINLPGLSNTSLRALLAERLGIPVKLEHDAKAAALGDFHYGAGRGARSMAYITIGTGVGAALILDGQLYYGDRNAAGEIGHITIDRYGEVCSCGTRGCVETFMSGPWLIRRYLRAAAGRGVLFDTNITGERLAELAQSGDILARQVITEAGEALGIAVASLAMLVNVDLNVIGGSVAKLGDLLLDPARRTMPQFCFRALGAGVQILPSALDDRAPILGCAWLARAAHQEILR
ncbi:MAG: ROK family protein [Chloroflexota bacterium]|nr:ROK family protein [Chloroflexota bacterium]